jgi:hypothetical protein
MALTERLARLIVETTYEQLPAPGASHLCRCGGIG